MFSQFSLQIISRICPQFFNTTDYPLVQIPSIQAPKLISLPLCLESLPSPNLACPLNNEMCVAQVIYLKHKCDHVSPSSPNLKIPS